MIHADTFKVRRSDPATEARLAALRGTLAAETAAAARLESARARALDASASRARAAAAAAAHARAEAATEAGRRAPDRAFFVRPQGAAARDAWAHGELRAWYGGAAGGGGADEALGADFAAPPLGAALRASGYAAPARAGAAAAPNPFAAPAPGAARDAPPRNEVLNAARAAALGAARAAAARAHWTDRDALLRAGAASARALLGATGYAPDLVATSRPFRDRPPEEDAPRFAAPDPRALRDAMATARADGARENVGNAARARETKLVFAATDTRNYW